MRLLSISLVSVGCGAAFAAGIAFAQTASQPSAEIGQLEEIVVTAERRETDIQKAATSVSVRTGQELQEQGKFTLRQIVEDVPGVTAVDVANINVGGNDILGNNITIRGVSPNPPAGVASPPPTTAVYVDGIYEGVGSQYDIERVEINRGPQGTLYGRSATSGVYAVYTANPSIDGIKGNASVEFGNYSLQHYSAALNVPAGDRFAARLSADQYHQGEGYYNGPGGERKKTSARLKMLYKPTDDLSILLGGALEDNETHTGYVTRAVPVVPVAAPYGAYTETPVPVRNGENKHRQLWTEINWDMAAAKLTYLGAVRTWEQDDDQFVGQFTPEPAPSFIHQVIKTPFDQFITHELRLTSNQPSSLVWQTGVSYYDNRIRNSSVNELIPNLGSPPPDNRIATTLTSKDTKAYGIFGEATYSFTDATRLTAGLRYDETQVKTDLYNEANLNFPVAVVPPGSNIATLSSGEITRNFYNTTYKLRLEQDLTPSNLVYASVSSGFAPGDVYINKVGGPPFTPVASLVVNPVEPETLTAYEIGSKNRFLDDTLQVNAGLFYYRYGGFLVSFQTNPLDPSVMQVAIPARNYGAELESLWQVTTSDRIGLNYNYVRSKWVDKPADYAAAYPNEYRSVVPHTASLNYEHVFRFGDGSSFTARIDGRWQSSYTEYQDVRSSTAFRVYQNVESRTIGNINLSWLSSNGNYSVAGYVRNFTNERTPIYTPANNVVNVTFTDPRTYGVLLSVRY